MVSVALLSPSTTVAGYQRHLTLTTLQTEQCSSYRSFCNFFSKEGRKINTNLSILVQIVLPDLAFFLISCQAWGFFAPLSQVTINSLWNPQKGTASPSQSPQMWNGFNTSLQWQLQHGNRKLLCITPMNFWVTEKCTAFKYKFQMREIYSIY